MFVADADADADADTGAVLWVAPDLIDCCPTISPDGRLVTTVDVVEGEATRLSVWDVATGDQVAEAAAADLGLYNNAPSANFTPDGDHVDIAMTDGVARLRVDDLRPVAEAATPSEPQGYPDTVPGTDHIVWGGTGGRIWRIDMSTGQVVATGQSRDTSTITSLDVSPDGTMVAAYLRQQHPGPVSRRVPRPHRSAHPGQRPHVRTVVLGRRHPRGRKRTVRGRALGFRPRLVAGQSLPRRRPQPDASRVDAVHRRRRALPPNLPGLARRLLTDRRTPRW
jgi:hypothetical protein